jgi:hypothetical protein
MKKTAFLLTLALIAVLLFTSTNALAISSVAEPAAKTKTPGPPTNGTHGPPGGAPGQSGMNPGMKGKPEHYKGTISAYDSASITLTLVDGTSVTIGITPDTRVHGPGKGGVAITPQVGMTAMVQARRDESNNLVARFIQIIPGKPALTHRVGEVTEYTEGSSITILAMDGNSYTFTLTAETKILPAERADELAVGSWVTIIAPRDPAMLGWTATGIVVHPGTEE